jgi:mitochondrial intermediate peptidase
MQVASSWKRSYGLLFRPRIFVQGSQLCGKRYISSLPEFGLLSLPAFKSAEDFPLRSAEAIKLCSALREEVSKEKDPLKTLLLLDQISNEVCSVLDVAEFCRNAHDDELYREKAEHAFSTLSLFIHNLNTDITLYSALQRIVDTDSIFKLLPDEHKLFAKDLKSEFESGGIHLLGNEREEAVALQAAVVESETKFVQETSRVEENSHFNIGPFQNKNDHARFSSWLGQYVQQDESMPPYHVTCSPNRRISGAVLRSLDEESHRETVWMNMASEPSNNINNLGQLIKGRQALAKVLGFESFAHKYLANKVLKTPLEVQTFLTDVAATVRPKAQKQLETLKSLKRTLLGNNCSIDLKPWDISYLTNMAVMSQDQGKVDSIAEYFPLNSCIEGLIGITESLFGVKVRISDVIGPEAWLGTSHSSSTTLSHSYQPVKFGYFSGAIKCDFVGASGDSLGTVYLDLFHR